MRRAVLRREPLRLRLLLCASITLARTGLRCWIWCDDGSGSLEVEVGAEGNGMVAAFENGGGKGAESIELREGALGGVFEAALWLVVLSFEELVRKKGNLERMLPEELRLWPLEALSEFKRDLDRGLDGDDLGLLEGEGGLSEGVRARAVDWASLIAVDDDDGEGEDERASSTSGAFCRRSAMRKVISDQWSVDWRYCAK